MIFVNSKFFKICFCLFNHIFKLDYNSFATQKKIDHNEKIYCFVRSKNRNLIYDLNNFLRKYNRVISDPESISILPFSGSNLKILFYQYLIQEYKYIKNKK